MKKTRAYEKKGRKTYDSGTCFPFRKNGGILQRVYIYLTLFKFVSMPLSNCSLHSWILTYKKNLLLNRNLRCSCSAVAGLSTQGLTPAYGIYHISLMFCVAFTMCSGQNVCRPFDQRTSNEQLSKTQKKCLDTCTWTSSHHWINIFLDPSTSFKPVSVVTFPGMLIGNHAF